MFRIDDPSAVSVLPTPEAASTEGYFTEGNPGVTPATLVRASFLNMLQEEMRAVVIAGGLTPSKTTYSQVLNAINVLINKVTNGKSGSVYYQGIPTSGVVTTFTRTLTFIAPSNGVVFAIQSDNVSGNQPATQTNTVQISSASGSASSTDTTLSTMSNNITKAVLSGETVTITGTVASNGATAVWYNNGISLSYIFTPSN